MRRFPPFLLVDGNRSLECSRCEGYALRGPFVAQTRRVDPAAWSLGGAPSHSHAARSQLSPPPPQPAHALDQPGLFQHGQVVGDRLDRRIGRELSPDFIRRRFEGAEQVEDFRPYLMAQRVAHPHAAPLARLD